FLAGDSMARNVAKHLEGVELVHCRSPDLLLEEDGKFVILDVVKGIKEPMVLQDIEKLKTTKMVSLHDFDVAYVLKLLKEMGRLQDIRIIGVPDKGDPEKIAKKVRSWI
ncbi:MAG: hypothetical protein ABIH41_02110, partial [Nanoarchaeota archaeon]